MSEAVVEERTDVPKLFPTRTGFNYRHHPLYDELPAAVQSVYSPKDYAWLDDEGRRTLIFDLTMPSVDE